MKAIRFTVAVLVVGGVAVLRGWNDPFHYWIGTTALAAIGAAALLWKRLRGSDWEAPDAGEDEPVEGVPRACFFGLLTGLAASVVLTVTFAGAGRIQPLVRLFCDADRPSFEAHLEPVIAAGNHAQAIAMLEERLRAGKLSRDWSGVLNQALYGEMLEAARASATVAQRTNYLCRAVSVARAAGLDDQLALERLKADAERVSTRAKLEELKANRHWPDLIAALQFAMKDKATNEWEVPYGRWLLDAYVEWAKDSPALDAKQAKLQLAVKVARESGLDPAPALALLKAAEQEAAVGALVQDTARREREKAQRERLRAELESHYRAQLAAGEQFTNADPRLTLEGRRELYGQARDFAATNGLDVAVATNGWARCDAELAALLASLPRPPQPADLSPGARARLVRVGTDRYPPSLDLELAVEDAQGKLIRGLAGKDFQVFLGGRSVTNVAVAPVQTQPPPLSLVVAVDCSSSMAGAPLHNAVAGAQAMIRSLATEDQVSVRVLTFNGRVESCCAWTNDVHAAADTLARCTANGGTALFAAVELGGRELAGRAGDRRLVLFTDGGDNASPHSLEPAALLAGLKTNQVHIFAIGLQTKDLDQATLKGMTAGTGGRYFEAKKAGEIAGQFLAARQQLRREFYRLVLSPAFDPGAGNVALEVRVGGEPAAVASGSVQLTPPPQTARK